MEEWLSVREATSHLSKVLQKAQSIDELEALMVDVIPKFVSLDGLATIRHIRHIGKLFVSHTYGIYNNLLHSYTDDDKGLSGYIIRRKTPLFINRGSDIPPTVNPIGTYKEGEYYAMFPLLDSTGEVMLIVAAIKVNTSFATKDITTLRSMVIQSGIIYEKIYLKTRMQRFKDASELIVEFTEKHLKEPAYNILTLANDTLQLFSKTIKGAEAGSILMKTPEGFRFIGSIGYKGDLLNKPPIPIEHQQMWYGLPKDMWQKGVPRIIGKEEIQKRDSVEYDAEERRTIADAQVTLGIPIVVENEVKYFLNLDNFTSPAAFDDVDIDIAKLIGSIFATLSDIGRKYMEDNTYKALIHKLSVPHFAGSKELSRKTIIMNFVRLVVDNLMVLKPDYILAMHEPMQQTWDILYPEKPTSDEALNIIGSIDTDKESGETYIPYEGWYISWTTQKLSTGNIRVAVLKKNFLPHGSWWKDTLTLIVSYFTSFVRILSYTKDIRELVYNTAFRIGKLLEEISLEPPGHMDFMKDIGPKFAKKILSEVPDDFILGLYLHDIGKLLLTGKERISDDTNKHVVLGSKLIESVKLDHLTYLYNMVKYHHEKAMGGGPFGLKGSNIPREAEIVGMLCHFHHLIAKGMDIIEALRVIHSYAPSHYTLMTANTLKDVVGENSGN